MEIREVTFAGGVEPPPPLLDELELTPPAAEAPEPPPQDAKNAIAAIISADGMNPLKSHIPLAYCNSSVSPTQCRQSHLLAQ
jgi:hypothetical protein